MPVDFAKIANAAIDRGFAIIPLLPNKKDPSYLATHGAKSRTRDRSLVATWAEELPNANVGVCADSEITILESDDETKFRHIVREVSKSLFGFTHELPPTFTVQATPNRPHWFYKNTATTLTHDDSPGIAGLYEWRHHNQYVVGFGSIHPSGSRYEIVLDTDIIPMPDWLVTVLGEIKAAYHGARNAASSFVKVGPAGIVITALKTEYALDPEALLADPEFKITVPPGERHYFLNSIAGLLHNGHRSADELNDILRFFCDKYCVGSDDKGNDEILRIAEWAVKRDPCIVGSIEFWTELKSFATREEKTAFDKQFEIDLVEIIAEATEATETTVDDKELPAYPLDIWADTSYAEFARICGTDTPIPPEWLIEGLKTAAGAIMGNRLVLDIRGGLPRFYTMLIGEGGSGKGTAISYVKEVFSGISGLAIDQPLLWGQTTPIETIKHKHIGACTANFASGQGMQRALAQSQTRWFQIYEEYSPLAESSQIKGSGQGLLAANRQLYDGEHFTTTATATRDSFTGCAQNSILGACTRELWNDMFAGQSIEGSGLFQRFNIIPCENLGPRVPLKPPDLQDFKKGFLSRLLAMDAEPVELTATDEAIKEVINWTRQFQGMNADEYGRLDILAWRNAMHIAFWRNRRTVGLKEIRAALKLSDYQFQIRRRYKPAVGNNQAAIVENKILTALAGRRKPITVRELQRLINANQYGRQLFYTALKNLKDDEIEVLQNPARRDSKLVILKKL